MVPLGVLYGLLAAAGWGTADFFAKISVTREKNFVPLHISNLVGFILITAYLALYPLPGFSLLQIIPSMAIVSFFMSCGWILFWLSLRSGKVSIQTPIGASFGLITLVLAVIFLGESPSLIQIMGAILVVLGVFVVSLPKFSLKVITFDRNAVMAMVAAICWGIGYIFLAMFAKGLPPLIAFQSQIFFSSLFTVLFTIAYGNKLFPSRLSNLLPPLATGIVDGGGLLAYFLGIYYLQTSLLAPISSTYPVFAIILSWLFLKETLKRYQVASVATIIIGIILISV